MRQCLTRAVAANIRSRAYHMNQRRSAPTDLIKASSANDEIIGDVVEVINHYLMYKHISDDAMHYSAS